jgi:hypothetical protein
MHNKNEGRGVSCGNICSPCFEATANVAHNPSPKASNTGRYDKQKVMQI